MADRVRILVLMGGVLAFLGVCATAQANDQEPGVGSRLVAQVKAFVQAVEPYRTPVAPQPTEQDGGKSCRDLERELAALQPMTYSYKPDFYDDPVQGTAFWVGTTLFFPAYGVLGYSGYYEYRENERIYTAQDRIETLRRLKAEKRCFES